MIVITVSGESQDASSPKGTGRAHGQGNGEDDGENYGSRGQSAGHGGKLQELSQERTVQGGSAENA